MRVKGRLCAKSLSSGRGKPTHFLGSQWLPVLSLSPVRPPKGPLHLMTVKLRAFTPRGGI